MAERTIRVDDLDGTPIYEGEGGTVTVAFGEESYDLDLTDKHIKELGDLLAPYLAAGRGDRGKAVAPSQGRILGTLPSQPARAASDRRAFQEIRKWANKNGFKVSERGRIPYSVMDAYTKSHLATR